MRTAKHSRKFKQDFKRGVRGKYRDVIAYPSGELWEVVDALADNIQLPAAYRDHSLHGTLEGKRECHIRPDLLLVYTYINDDLLILERLGSHSEIFGL